MAEPGNVASSNYESIVNHETYQQINERLVDLAAIDPYARVVDLGGGNGSVAAILLERAPATTLWVVDPDEIMLSEARLRLGERAQMVRGVAADVAALFEPASVDAFVLGNCIHLVDEIGEAFGMIRDALTAGGKLAFNTAFYEGADRPEERHLYWQLVVDARRILGENGIKVSRSGKRPLAKRRLDRAFYERELLAHGFRVQLVSFDTFELDKEMVSDIVSAPMFAGGALPGVEPVVAAEAMKRAVARITERRPIASIARTWMTIVAARSELAHGEENQQ